MFKLSRRAGLGSGHRRVAAAGFVLLVVVVASGCGVSSSSSPTDLGDALVSDASLGSDLVRSVPDPNAVSTPEALVRSYLMAAVGGGEAASNQVKAFLTTKARSAWVEPRNPKNPELTVVRLVGAPVRGETRDERLKVTVDYQVVGPLTDQGRVEELAALPKGTMTFYVKQAEQRSSQLRIDEIVGGPEGLIISDDALVDLYRPQPIYFWDSANSRLVPDLRFLPLTLTTELRALKLLQWLLDGPSPWLTGAQRLPAGTVRKGGVINRDGVFVVNLSDQAGAGGPEAVRRLFYQLRWTLRSSTVPAVELQIEDKVAEISGTQDEYLQYNQTTELPPVGRKFGIVERKVVPLGSGATPPAVLGSADNRNVVHAALNRRMNLAAFVQEDSVGRRTLHVAREGSAARVKAGLSSFSIGRPVWVPGSKDQMIVPSGGALYAVAADGASAKLTSGQVNGVTRVAVAPDGRRVAFVASGQAYVASLRFDGKQLSIGSNLRPVLAGQLTASAIAWENESWLYVGGTANGKEALWRVTADSVVAENLSAELDGVTPTDMVAYPTNPESRVAELYVLTDQSGAYLFVTSLGPFDPAIQAPFFAS